MLPLLFSLLRIGCFIVSSGDFYWYSFVNLIYSKTWDDHVAHLDIVLGILDWASLFAKESECALAMIELLYLGHISSADEVRMDPDKICAIVEWPHT